MDIHAGEGGHDSRLFARTLLTAYLKFAAQLQLECEVVYDSDSSCSILVTGTGCWEAFGNESGKHVVQRIPPTESRGRRHTSVVAVAVLPLRRQTDDVLLMSEVKITTQRGHGKGGQNQNKVESAVRAVHVPTGFTVFVNGRDQNRNKELALQILRARVSAEKRDRLQRAHAQQKAEQLGYGNRSGKIRTYNFINSLVIDHRSGKRTHRIDEVLKGRFDLLR